MTEESNITVLKDRLKTIALQILEIERERMDCRADMSDLKKELNCLMPKSYIPKAIKVYLGKGMLSDQDIQEYQDICSFLGTSYTCGVIQPDQAKYDTDDQKVLERREKVFSVLKRYRALQEECNEMAVQIRDLYAKARSSNISVPLLKKLVDFVLHPDKLEAYNNDTPLLEVYTEVIPDLS